MGHLDRLASERNLWLATVGPDGRPHLTPIWFVWHDEHIWICTCSDNVKTRNVRRDPHVTFSLEDGNAPVVGSGTAVVHARPYPSDVIDAFGEKFVWDIRREDADDGAYDALWEITVDHWLMGAA